MRISYDNVIITHLISDKSEIISEVSMWTVLNDKTEWTSSCHTAQHTDYI